MEPFTFGEAASKDFREKEKKEGSRQRLEAIGLRECIQRGELGLWSSCCRRKRHLVSEVPEGSEIKN